MLSANAYSFRQKSKLAISLSWIGGYTNVVTLLSCGWVSSHVTGPITWFGRVLVEGSGPVGESTRTAFFFAFVIVAFFLGAALSAVMTEGAERLGKASKFVLPMAVEATLLSLFAIGLNLHTATELQTTPLIYAATGLACLAMGLQNATITRISGAVVRTTHVTGVITDLGLEGVQYLFWFYDQARGKNWRRKGRLLRVSQRHPAVLRLLLLASIFGSFLLGAVAGTFVFLHRPTMAMLLPIAFLCFIIFMDWWRPISDVRELDLLSDPELKVYGLIHSLLPPSLGIYRMTAHKHGGKIRAPNFQNWAEHLPSRWKVVILAVTPIMRLTENALIDLETALARLESDGRKLILSGISTKQYKALDHRRITDRVGAENICVDLEFAIARGIDLVRDFSAGSTGQSTARASSQSAPNRT
jgi:uncharacterized membrane protein YoaK (UPF0700 family)